MSLGMLLVALTGLTPHKAMVHFDGMYVEGCSCSPPCPCEITGVKMGCQGVGGFAIKHGTFEGSDISGIKLAYAVAPGDWVICYIDAPTAAKKKAGAALAKAAFNAWGKMEPVKNAPISIHGSGGKYTLTVGGGEIMKLTTTPWAGLNKSK